MNIFKLIILSLVLVNNQNPALAAEKPQIIFEGKKNNSSKPKIIITTVKSKTIQVHRLKGEIEFLNNVIVEREDTSFLADKMIVYYDENQKNKQLIGDKANNAGSIEKIDAFDNVKIFQEEFVATGDIGSYDPKSGIFTIEQNAVFNNGSSVAKGEKFIYNINTKKGYLVGRKKDDNKIQNSEIDKNSSDKRVIVIINDDAKNLKPANKSDKELNNE